jgi:putative IMPACT (imprinted ancient) family translation regulator
MSDDGEPAGTTGPPLLAVLRGSNAGDLVVVVTRYFGGTKLGTGGLVRAYTEAAQSVLAAAEFTVKRDQLTLGLDVPYALFETARRAIVAEGGEIIDQSFAADVTLLLRIDRGRVEGLQRALADLSAGSLAAVCLD